MRYSSLYIVLILLSTFACNNINSKEFGQNKLDSIDIKKLILKPELGLYFYNNEPFTGIALSYYPTQKMASAISMLKGKKHGLYKKWFDDGNISFWSEYKNGKRHGTTKTWWRNKVLRSELSYQNGVANGTQLQWYKSGVMFKKIQLVDGKEKGLQQSWRENGKIYNNYEAKDGKIYGLKRSKLCFELKDQEIQYAK